MATSLDPSSSSSANPCLRVVLTRPEDRQAELVQTLQSMGCEVLQLPALTICPLEPTEQSAHWQPERFEAIVFVSRGAWQNYRKHYWKSAGQSNQQTNPNSNNPIVACVGVATAKEIARDLQVPLARVTYPEGDLSSDSEGLWKLLQHELKPHARVLIVRGESGRDWLADTLASHGLQVSALSVYRRQANAWTSEQVQALLAWSQSLQPQLSESVISSDSGVWLITSGEGLEAIAAQFGAHGLTGRPGLQPKSVVVVHQRLVEPVRRWLANWQVGEIPVAVSAPNDETIVKALVKALVQSRG